MRRTTYLLSKFLRELQLTTVGWEGRAAGARDGRGGDNQVSDAYRLCSDEVQLLLHRSVLHMGATYPPDTVFTHHELADALGCTVAALQKADMPVSYVLGKKAPRYVWREVAQRLRDTSEGGIRRNRRSELRRIAESWQAEAEGRRSRGEEKIAEVMEYMAAEVLLAIGDMEPIEVPPDMEPPT